ncbi:MAG TPA: serine/threonine-protein kinase [Candidatus Limnocylindrales bacterium]|nr:serine/threonine-protein kinase [Candidatus Limnocylindrales bacterium]
MSEPIEPPPPPQPAAGRLVGERYRLAEVIGSGGMATIHRAFDTLLGRTVAVKLLRREVMADADIAMRFRREALAATVLRHPNIVACLETGTDDGQPYLVMELIEGEDLAARLKRVGRLAPAEAARIGLDVARALGVAHTRGIIHRDIKPGNILLARDGRAMVTDFGIARLASDAEGAVPGTTLGSVHYFSPEQAKGETTTGASDVYGLGLVLYECLTGRRAWSGETTAELAAVRIGAAAPSPRAVQPDVPTALETIVVRALDPDPNRRFANGTAMAAALSSIVSRPDPLSPTDSIDTGVLVAGAAALAGDGTAPAMHPHGIVAASSPIRAGMVRRPPRAIGAPLLVLVTVLALVGGALMVAAASGRDDAAGLAIASPSHRPVPSSAATVRPTATATPAPTPTRTAKPTATPRPTPKQAGGVRDLCDPILGFACRLDAGAYEPSRFAPAIRFTLGSGWSASAWAADLIALGRSEGNLTLASAIRAVYPSGQAMDPPRSAKGLVETFIGTDGVAARRPVNQHVDKRRATLIDLTPTGPDRVALFGTSTQIFYLEPSATTRIIVIDALGGPMVIAIEPVGASTLENVLPATNPTVKSFRFR